MLRFLARLDTLSSFRSSRLFTVYQAPGNHQSIMVKLMKSALILAPLALLCVFLLVKNRQLRHELDEVRTVNRTLRERARRYR